MYACTVFVYIAFHVCMQITMYTKCMPTVWCCIIFFFQLTAISVVVLVKAIAEAISDNRDFKGISSDHFIRI